MAVTCEIGLVSLASLWSCETEAREISDGDLGGGAGEKSGFLAVPREEEWALVAPASYPAAFSAPSLTAQTSGHPRVKAS